MTFDASKIELQEHVPLTYKEKEKYLQQTKDLKRVAPVISTFTTGVLIFMFYWANGWKISGHNNEDYIVFFIGMLLCFYVVYGSIYAYAVYDKNKFLKDFKNGKQILTSFIVNRDKTEYDTMLTFALPNGNEARLFASDEDYAYFRKGDFVQVTFLASSRVIVKIEMIEEFLE